MKKMLYLLVVLLLCVTAQSQEKQEYSFDQKQLYLQKSRSQITTAIVLACTGGGLMVMKNGISFGNGNWFIGPNLFRAIGLGCVGASIHYLILAGNNKSNAAVFFDMQREPSPTVNTGGELMPAISVKMGIR
jgi:hypothetical protein